MLICFGGTVVVVGKSKASPKHVTKEVIQLSDDSDMDEVRMHHLLYT